MSAAADPVADPAFGPERLGLRALAGVLEASLDGVAVVDAGGRFLYANPALCAMLGQAREELLGRHFLGILHPSEREATVARFASRVGGEAGRASGIVVRADGEEREVETSEVAFVVEGRPLVVGVVRDVTEPRRRARQATALAQVAASLAADQPVEATLDALATSVVEATRAVACAVALGGGPEADRLAGSHGLPDGAEAAVEAARRAGPEPARAPSPGSRRPTVLRGVRAKILADPGLAPAHPCVRGVPWDTVVALPLVFRDRAVGRMDVCYLPGQEPPEAELAFLAAIADHAAVAAETARLVADAQGWAALEERQRLARELHDSVSQALYGIGLGASAVRAWLDVDPARAVEPSEYVVAQAEAALAEMRALIFELRPEALEREGLVAALERRAAALRVAHGLVVEAALGEEPNAPLEAKEALHRIAQEVLHNAAKHARAAAVTLRLARGAAGLVLEIGDDGVGFDPTDPFPGHLGLRSMRERAERLGGTLVIESAPGQGARVRAEIPC